MQDRAHVRSLTLLVNTKVLCTQGK